ncbi:unnamed protein product [Linum tenue]|uniref:Uncharacterized protein n=1 Tax=Linum tenue TaxID=586396 RepID=A0AAV0K9H6_9ROSI|nr:unnamed protein product [Linum tenue]
MRQHMWGSIEKTYRMKLQA